MGTRDLWRSSIRAALRAGGRGLGVALAVGLAALAPSSKGQVPFGRVIDRFEQQSSLARGEGRACAWGSPDCNPCVADVAASVRSLRNRGDILGFYKGPAPDPKLLKHWQGVQRLMGAHSDNLLVSTSNADEAGVLTVSLGGRGGDGLRFRSNRLGSGSVEDTAPPQTHIGVRYLRLERNYTHASGFQTVGHFAAVGLEGATNGARGRVVIISYAAPTEPVLQGRSTLTNYPSSDAGTASIARLASGRYLLIVGNSNANDLFFYRSTTGDLRNTRWESVATWNKSAVSGWGAYQNISLVGQCDGQLFLIGTHNDSDYTFGDDRIAAYLLSLNLERRTAQLTPAASRHVYCSWGPLEDQCNLDAAGGVYVDPDGRLIVYATEHDNDGPGGSVKMAEFRSAVAPTRCSRIEEAWAELYDDKDFGDRGLMIDFTDRRRERYDNFDHVEGFGDKTSSARACLPPGWRFSLYEHDGYRGSRRDLVGTGQLVAVSSFGGFGDETSSARYECRLPDGAWTSEIGRCRR